ncbi:MAG: M48 family metalloprotease [Bdellovibrionaceae bacterium]|nr:M48 family metalloprotease [Pseudobdellovibrionaceae bacterium]
MKGLYKGLSYFFISFCIIIPQAKAEINLWQSTYEYWAPKVKNTYQTTQEYWAPRVEKTMRKSALAFDDYFRSQIHPNVKKLYKAYYDKWGQQVGELTVDSLVYISKVVQLKKEQSYEYWRRQFPEFISDLERIPSPLKKAYEKFIYMIWRSQEISTNAIDHMPDKYKKASEFAVMIVNAIKNKTEHPQTARLKNLLEKLRNFSQDPEMRSCYDVHIIELGFNNAFNTGCNIFITEEMANTLSDENLMAVLAHEMSHGDLGHSVESMLYLISSGGTHVAKLVLDELVWFSTGEQSERLKRVLDEGNFPIILETFGQKAPVQEMEADHGGACLLKAAGLPQEWMRETLLKIHDVDSTEYQEWLKNQKEKGDSGSVRQYPSLQKRMEVSYCD